MSEAQLEKKNQRLSFEQIWKLCEYLRTVQAGCFKSWPAVTAEISEKLGFPVSQSSVERALEALGRSPRELLATADSVSAMFEARVRALEEELAGLRRVVEGIGQALNVALETMTSRAVSASSMAPVPAGNPVPMPTAIPGVDRVGGVDIDSADLDVD